MLEAHTVYEVKISRIVISIGGVLDNHHLKPATISCASDDMAAQCPIQKLVLLNDIGLLRVKGRDCVHTSFKDRFIYFAAEVLEPDDQLSLVEAEHRILIILIEGLGNGVA